MKPRGAALVLAVVTLAVLLAVGATALELALIGRRTALRSLGQVRASAAAEAALVRALAGWPARLRPGPGEVLPFAPVTTPGLVGSADATGLPGGLVLLEARGASLRTDGGTLASARIRVTARIDTLGPDSMDRARPLARSWHRVPP